MNEAVSSLGNSNG